MRPVYSTDKWLALVVSLPAANATLRMRIWRATKALGCKLAKAAWHVMKSACEYDPKRMFPDLANKAMKTS